MLEDKPDLALADVASGGVLAMEEDRASVGRLQAGDDPQEGGLTGTGRAEQRHQLAGLDLQADLLERLKRAEALADITDFDAHLTTLSSPSVGAIWPAASCRRACHSIRLLATSVTRASSTSSEATAKAAV